MTPIFRFIVLILSATRRANRFEKLLEGMCRRSFWKKGPPSVYSNVKKHIHHDLFSNLHSSSAGKRNASRCEGGRGGR
jgi:hypothetical protein